MLSHRCRYKQPQQRSALRAAARAYKKGPQAKRGLLPSTSASCENSNSKQHNQGTIPGDDPNICAQQLGRMHARSALGAEPAQGKGRAGQDGRQRKQVADTMRGVGLTKPRRMAGADGRFEEPWARHRHRQGGESRNRTPPQRRHPHRPLIPSPRSHHPCRPQVSKNSDGRIARRNRRPTPSLPTSRTTPAHHHPLATPPSHHN